MVNLALVGADVSNSGSPKIHSFIAKSFNKKISYSLISLKADEFDTEIEKALDSFDGVNITAPYKLLVMRHLKSVRGAALNCGSVNTVVCANRLGFNTDCAGFMHLAELFSVHVIGSRVLVLGAGGAARCVVYSLTECNADVFVYSRTYKRAEELSKTFKNTTALKALAGEYDVIVNATGVGAGESEGLTPAPADIFRGAKNAIDLIYKPAQTEFLRLAKSSCLNAVNGFSMLFFQAYYSDCLYFCKAPDKEEAVYLYKKYIEKGNDL